MTTSSFRLSSLTAPLRFQNFGGFQKFLGGAKILGGDSKSLEEFLKIRRGFKYYILLMAGLQFRYAHVYT